MGKSSTTFLVLAIISTLLFCTWGGVRIVKGVSFDMNCTQYLKRAADANTVEMAKEEIGTAISYAESKNLTQGRVSIFLSQPSNDVGFWYGNLKASYEELDNLPEDSSPLERANVLMKLRETLTVSSGGTSLVAIPAGISIYPNNVFYFWWSILSIICTFAFWILFVISLEEFWD